MWNWRSFPNSLCISELASAPSFHWPHKKPAPTSSGILRHKPSRVMSATRQQHKWSPTQSRGLQALALRRCQADRSAVPPAPQTGAATEHSCPHAHPYRGWRPLGQGHCKNCDSELQSATFSHGYKTSALPFFNYKARNAPCPDHLPVTLLERK